MNRDSETLKENLSEYFKSNPKDWELIKQELEYQIGLAKDKAVARASTDFDKGIVEGLRIAIDIERYYKKWIKS